jgi:hypothetical protein
METDSDGVAHEARANSGEAAGTEGGGTRPESEPMVVLPVVVVPADDVSTDQAAAPRVEEDRPPRDQERLNTPAETASALPADVRELIERLKPTPISLWARPHDDPDRPDDIQMSYEEAVEHFVSRGLDAMRELESKGLLPPGDQAPGSAPPDQGGIQHAFEHRDDSSGGREIVQPLLRAGDPVEMPTQLGHTAEPAMRGPAMPTAGSEPRETAPVVVHASAAVSEPAGMPRLQIFVQLLDARSMFESAMETALARKKEGYRQIAELEVTRGFRRYEDARRAADYRLRGPG